MLLSLLRLLRPRDWVKNAIVLVPVVFAVPALRLGSATAIDAETPSIASLAGPALGAFVSFCLVASGFYAINDALDADDDRRHPLKRDRPVASGVVGRSTALGVGGALVVAGLLGGASIDRPLGVLLAVYTLLQVAYNGGLDRVMHVDAMMVAAGYGLRAAAGAVAIRVPLSIWMLLCLLFLGLYVGFVKRLCDVASATASGDPTWRSRSGYEDRGELTWLLGLTGALTVLTYLMYALSDHAAVLFGARSRGFALLSPLVLIAIHRLYRRSRSGFAASPIDAMIQDRTVRSVVIVFTIGVIATLYVPAVGRFLGHLFVAGG